MRLPALTFLILYCAAAQAQPVAWLWDGASLPPWSAPEAAVLLRHILLSGATASTRPRATTPALAPGTRVTPVVHVEVSIVHPPQQIEQQAPLIIQAVRDAAAASSSGWVQLDMEAHPSQRQFYRELVHQLRATLPADIRLSVTALAWWCRSPAWLDGLEADEVVPMFFRMGRDGAAMRQLLEQSPQTLHPRCRSGSAGFSPQETFSTVVTSRYQKTYWFDRHAWRQPGPLPNARTTP